MVRLIESAKTRWWRLRANVKKRGKLSYKEKQLFRKHGICYANSNFHRLYDCGLLSPINTEAVEAARAFQRHALGRELDPVLHVASQNLLGHADPGLLPWAFYWKELIPYLNDMGFRDAYSDKNLYGKLVETKAQPVTVLQCAGGNFFDHKRSPISCTTPLSELLEKDIDYIAKPSRTDNGEWIRSLAFRESHFLLESMEVHTPRCLKQHYGANFLVQERLEQHQAIAEIYPQSVNTLRILTLRWRGVIFVLLSLLRVGANGSITDNSATGGVSLGIQPDGRPFPYGLSSGIQKVFAHPTTGFEFSKAGPIPGFREACDLCVALHQGTLHHNLISWDICINTAGEPVFLEFNFRGALLLSQLTLGQPLLGSLSEEILGEMGRNSQSVGMKRV